MSLRLTYAGEDHFDRVKALELGIVKPRGIELTCVHVGVRELFRRQAALDCDPELLRPVAAAGRRP